MMTENEYILVRNLSAVKHIRAALGEMVPGEDCGVPQELHSELVDAFMRLENRLHDMIELEESL